MAKRANATDQAGTGHARTGQTEPGARDRILAAVVAGLRELDPGALTIQQVCRRADVTAPTIYYHFGNKDGLVAAGVADLVTRWLGQLDALVDRSGTWEQSLEQAVSAWEAMICSPERPFAVFVWVSMWSDASRATLIRGRAHALDLIRAGVVPYVGEGPAADDAAGLILDAVLGAAVEYQLDHDVSALRRRLGALGAIVRTGSAAGAP